MSDIITKKKMSKAEEKNCVISCSRILCHTQQIFHSHSVFFQCFYFVLFVHVKAMLS